jgi:hypothetical protein
VHCCRSRGLLWTPTDAANWVQRIVHSEASFWELAKHHYPECYTHLRCVAQPTAEQAVIAKATAPPAAPATQPSMDLQAPLSVTHNSSAANAPAAPLPVAGLPPRSRRRSSRAANVAQGASADGGVQLGDQHQPCKRARAAQQNSSYVGQPNTGTCVGCGTEQERLRYDKANERTKKKRKAAKIAKEKVLADADIGT